MAETNISFSGSIPQMYDRYLGPVLFEGGLFAFSVWDSMAANPYARLTHETLAKLFPAGPPQFFTVPFSFHDREVLSQFLTTYGFSDVRIQTVALEVRSESAQALATGFVRGSPLSATLQDRGVAFAPIIEALAEVFAHLGGTAPFRSTMQAVVVTARAGAA